MIITPPTVEPIVQQPLSEEQLLTIEILRGRFSRPVAWSAITEYNQRWGGLMEHQDGIRHSYLAIDPQTGHGTIEYAPVYYIGGPHNGWGMELIPMEHGTPAISILYDDCLDGHLYQVVNSHQELWDILHQLTQLITVANAMAGKTK